MLVGNLLRFEARLAGRLLPGVGVVAAHLLLEPAQPGRGPLAAVGGGRRRLTLQFARRAPHLVGRIAHGAAGAGLRRRRTAALRLAGRLARLLPGRLLPHLSRQLLGLLAQGLLLPRELLELTLQLVGAAGAADLASSRCRRLSSSCRRARSRILSSAVSLSWRSGRVSVCDRVS